MQQHVAAIHKVPVLRPGVVGGSGSPPYQPIGKWLKSWGRELRRPREGADYWTVKHPRKGIGWFSGPRAGKECVSREEAPGGTSPFQDQDCLDWAWGELQRYQCQGTGIGPAELYTLERVWFVSHTNCVWDSAGGLRIRPSVTKHAFSYRFPFPSAKVCMCLFHGTVLLPERFMCPGIVFHYYSF